MHSLLLLSALLLAATISAAPSNPRQSLENRDDANDIGILTTYFGYDGCSDDQKKQVQQAQKDAVMLATNAVKSPGINWGSDPAAIDFFGPADETDSRGTRQHIIDQLTGASKSYPGTGLSDWWNGRYVDLKCHDASDKSCSGAAAYTRLKSNGDKYPTIVFCPGFFSSARPSLADAKATIDKNNVLKGWVSALQSQALTFMHELFHIDFGTPQISSPPAKDQWISVGPSGSKKPIQAYKPGRGKLLAMTKNKGPELASANNDNLAYFTAAIYMTGLYGGNYPAKPRAWNPELSIEDNQKNDQIPPGPYSISNNDFEASDASGDDGDPNAAVQISAADLFPDSGYPPSYISTYGSPSSGDKPPAPSSTPPAASSAPTAASPTSPPASSTPTATPPTPPKFAPGWCGMHVVQYQKNEDSGPNANSPDYMIDVSIFDAKQQPIQIHDCNDCGTTARTIALNGAPNDFKTDLPVDMIVTLGAVDDDAILFKYGDQSWGSNDQEHYSNWGAYDNGKREGDTGFSC